MVKTKRHLILALTLLLAASSSACNDNAPARPDAGSQPSPDTAAATPFDRPAPADCASEDPSCLSPDASAVEQQHLLFEAPGGPGPSCSGDVDFCGTTVDGCYMTGHSHAVVLAQVLERREAYSCPMGFFSQRYGIDVEVVANLAGYPVPESLFLVLYGQRLRWDAGETYLVGLRESLGEWRAMGAVRATVVDYEPELHERDGFRVILPTAVGSLAEHLQERYDLYGADPECPDGSWVDDETLWDIGERDCPCFNSLPGCAVEVE